MLDKNLEALKESVLPEFAEKIRAAQRPDWVEVIRSADGRDNLLITDGSRKTTAWDMVDTMGRTVAQAAAMPVGAQDVVILAGFGLGYLLAEVLKKEGRHRDHKIVVIEPELWLVREALSRHDFSMGFEHRVEGYIPQANIRAVRVQLRAVRSQAQAVSANLQS